MKRLNGYSTEGMHRLITAVVEDSDMDDIPKLLTETRCRIAEEWAGYAKGLKLALAVFDELCLGHYDSEISVRHKVCRERVRQVHERLFELNCMKELKYKLRVMKRDSEC